MDTDVLTAANEVTDPSYYRLGGIQPIEVIEAWGLSFCLGNALKYICRAGFKPGAHRLDDLKKAAWYINREITREEYKHEGT